MVVLLVVALAALLVISSASLIMLILVYDVARLALLKIDDKTTTLQVPVEEAPDTTDAWGNP